MKVKIPSIMPSSNKRNAFQYSEEHHKLFIGNRFKPVYEWITGINFANDRAEFKECAKIDRINNKI